MKIIIIMKMIQIILKYQKKTFIKNIKDVNYNENNNIIHNDRNYEKII